MPTDSLKRRNLLILLASVSLFLASIEYLIPKPIPFMRLGLANIPVLLSLYLLPRRDSFLLVLLKVCGQGILYGTLFSYVFLFSAAGSFTGFAAMLLCSILLKDRVTPVGLAAVGALFSNLAQIALAAASVFGSSALLFAPLMLISGEISAVILGVFTTVFLNKSTFVKILGENAPPATDGISTRKTPLIKRDGLAPQVRLTGGILLLLCLLTARSPAVLGALLLWLILLNLICGNRILWLRNSMVLMGIVAMNLFPPEGRILLNLGPLSITEEALFRGAERSLRFLGLLMASRFTISPQTKLPGAWGTMIRDVLSLFSLLMEKRPRQSIKAPLKSLDHLLLELLNQPERTPEEFPRGLSPKDLRTLFLITLPAIVPFLLLR